MMYTCNVGGPLYTYHECVHLCDVYLSWKIIYPPYIQKTEQNNMSMLCNTAVRILLFKVNDNPGWVYVIM